ncbi:hypothetical protein CKAH01_16667 [Colletotrichum kahawae]|uniref:Uncharacterized protein n=1 Tax=Colletotrichum kahawae TaxID=34407 RepID=A0AAD9YDE9_COLKA|nr:hypothetical protein CKAH01_16667 [Colletotrichum kahawae]
MRHEVEGRKRGYASGQVLLLFFVAQTRRLDLLFWGLLLMQVPG